MTDTSKDRLLELCQQGANEQDPEKLLKIVREINDILAARARRLDAKSPPGPPEIC
jgi:hypothetical protein